MGLFEHWARIPFLVSKIRDTEKVSDKDTPQGSQPLALLKV